MNNKPKHTKPLEEIYIALEVEGVTKDKPEFEKMFRARKVEKCKELHNVNSCQDCSYFDSCSLIKEYLRDLHS